MGTRIETTDLARDALYTKVNQIADEKVNIDLDNLSATGQMIIDSQNGTISNCVLEIPQNLKLEFSNGTITLKAGSIITRSGSTYATLTTTQDITWSSSSQANATMYLFITNSGNAVGLYNNERIENVGSGSSLPADNSTYSLFFNTTDKLIYSWSNNTWSAGNLAYPLGIIETDENKNITGFAKDSNGNDMIFNGAGFIGHHAFVYPGVSGLLAFGVSNGNLNSKKSTTTSLQIIELTTGINRAVALGNVGGVFNTRYVEVDKYTDLQQTTYLTQYCKEKNQAYVWSGGVFTTTERNPIAYFLYNGTTVTDFTIRQPVRLATTEMLDTLQDQVDTNTTAIAGKQDTLVSGTNIKTINSNSVLGSGNFALADQSLSNLTADGQMIIDSQNGTISNCILDMPQNIKLTLENNVLTLKSGSVLTKTGSTYATGTVSTDRTRTIANTYTDGTYVVFANTSTVGTPAAIASIGSGASLPEDGSTYATFFNTTDKKIYHWSDSWNESATYYPICLIEMKSGVASFAKDSNGNDMIFNGAGFIGHHAFVYPNVTVFYPNGFSDNKHLLSVKITTNQLYITELATNRNCLYVASYSSQVASIYRGADLNDKNLITSNNEYHYITTENYVYSKTSSGYVQRPLMFFIDFNYNGTTVTDFTIRQPVRTATVEMLNKKQNDITSITGYDATKTQTLKNVNGVLTWVDD